MLRKSRIKPKEKDPNFEINADGVDSEPDVPNMEHVLFEGSPVPMASLAGPNHTLRYVNPAFCRLAGRTRNELVGKPFVEVIFWAGCLKLLDRVHASRQAVVQVGPVGTEAHPAAQSYTMWPICDADDHLVLLCYKWRRQQGHRGRDRAKWVAIRRRRVAIEYGLCRSVLTGSASGREGW